MGLLEHWLSASQAAALLGVSASRVGQLRREHVLPAERSPIGWLYPRELVHEMAAARGRHPAAGAHAELSHGIADLASLPNVGTGVVPTSAVRADRPL